MRKLRWANRAERVRKNGRNLLITVNNSWANHILLLVNYYLQKPLGKLKSTKQVERYPAEAHEELNREKSREGQWEHLNHPEVESDLINNM